jgi:hypothetical protein
VLEYLSGCNSRISKSYAFAEMIIHNSKVVGDLNPRPLPCQ